MSLRERLGRAAHDRQVGLRLADRGEGDGKLDPQETAQGLEPPFQPDEPGQVLSRGWAFSTTFAPSFVKTRGQMAVDWSGPTGRGRPYGTLRAGNFTCPGTGLETTRLRRVPRPSITISTVWPSRKVTVGWGTPVEMTSPGRRV